MFRFFCINIVSEVSNLIINKILRLLGEVKGLRRSNQIKDLKLSRPSTSLT
jgi:hypothetical protein